MTPLDPGVLHLLRRATFGPTPQLLRDVTAERAGAWLEQQFDPQNIPDPECDALLREYPGLDWPISRIRAAVDTKSLQAGAVMDRLVRASLVRAIWSRRQLLEIMVGLWSDHFNVTCPSDQVWDSRADYDATIRGLALGRFADLLIAVTTHPAMLRYLDGTSSTAEHPNENHGRELLELHTVGVQAGYREGDVLASARILTGLSVDGGSGQFVYRPDLHWTGTVQVLGFRRPNPDPDGGYGLVSDYLVWLARHPATARRVARRLAVRFVADDPPDSLVADLAAAYLAADTAIVPVLRRLFGSPEFAASAGRKVRRPLEDLVAAVRALDIRPGGGTAGVEGLYWLVAAAGQAPFGHPRPDGYPDGADWPTGAGLLARWNAHLGLAGGWWPAGLGYRAPADLLAGQAPATWGDLVDVLAARVVHRPMAGPHRDAVCTFLGGAAEAALDAADLDALVSPAAALILDSPYHAVC